MKNILLIQDNKFFLLVIIFYCFILIAHAQDEDYRKNYDLNSIEDAYVVVIKFNKKVYEKQSKCYCVSKKSCAIYQIDIVSVLSVPQRAELNHEDIKRIKYILADAEKIDSLSFLSEQIATLRPSSSSSYLVFNRVLEGVFPNEAINFVRLPNKPYLISIGKCAKLSFLNRIMIFLGLRNKEKLMESSTRFYEDPYAKFIQEYIGQ